MKTLTLKQPWASLVAFSQKKIETRSWRTPYRGPLAIHAAKGFPRDAREFASARGVKLALAPYMGDSPFPLGCVVATCYLISCLPTREIEVGKIIKGDSLHHDDIFHITQQEYEFGNYDPGRWAWLLADIKPLAVPIPAKGALSLWEWEPPNAG